MDSRFRVSKEEYADALTEACALVDRLQASASSPLSAADTNLKRFVAAIYDNSVPVDLMHILSVSDYERRDLLLVLLVGRLRYGRPLHARADDMLKWGHDVLAQRFL